MGLDEPRLGTLLDGCEQVPLADGIVTPAYLLPLVGGCDAGDLQEVVAVGTEQTLRSLVVTVILNQPHHLLGPGRA